jgi:cytochrome c biogenesis protein CcmG/thiol:disulfide interchange protein DsbE
MSNDEQLSTEAPSSRRRTHLLITGIIIAIAGVLVAVMATGLRLDTTRVPPANIDKAALPFHVAWVQGQSLLPQVSGEHFTLNDLKGRPVVLNFWASWCVSCRQEAHELEQFWQANKDKVTVVGIAIQDSAEDAKRFAAYFGKTYILGLDEDGKAAIDYGVSGVPETFLIDADGIIRHKEIGPVDAKQLAKNIDKILGKS